MGLRYLLYNVPVLLPIPNIVGMEVFNLKVVDGNRYFKKLMLYLFDNNVLSVNCEKYVAGFKVNSVSPTLAWNVEGMGRCCYYLFAVNRDVNELVRFVDISLEHLFKCGFAGVGIARPDKVAYLDVLNRNSNKSYMCKTTVMFDVVYNRDKVH